MDIGESVAIVRSLQNEDKCVFCSQQHDEPKKEDITETAPNDSGWHRKSMKGIFEKIPQKESIYPENFPPNYEYQGHHCVALSALVINASKPSRKDKRLRLNYFLKKVGFFPNRESNCIGLPARRSNGAYKAFWDSLDADAPLQMHGPGHDEDYFMKVNQLLIRMLGVMTHPEFCQEVEKADWEDTLKELIGHAENYAFNNLANNKLHWCLHPSEQNIAIDIYTAPSTREFIVTGARGSTRIEKGKGNSTTNIKFPNLNLDTGIF